MTYSILHTFTLLVVFGSFWWWGLVLITYAAWWAFIFFVLERWVFGPKDG
jgi:hypothetical protein